MPPTMYPDMPATQPESQQRDCRSWLPFIGSFLAYITISPSNTTSITATQPVVAVIRPTNKKGLSSSKMPHGVIRKNATTPDKIK